MSIVEAAAATGRHGGELEASPSHQADHRREPGMWSAARRCVVLLLGAALGACGPIYLHDPAGEAAALAARTQFQETLAKGRLSDLVGNYRAQNAEQTAATRALQKDDVRNQIYSLSAKPWSEVLTDTKTELQSTQDAITTAQSEFKALEESLTNSLQAHEDAAKRVDNLVEALNRAAASELRHAASQKLLAAGLQAIVDRQGNSAASRQALEDVLKAKVKGRAFKVKSDVLVETTEEKTVGAVLGIDTGLSAAIDPGGDSGKTLQALLKAVGGLGTLQGLQVGNPGIAVTIIGLGYDVSRAEERRLAATIDEAGRTRALYREQLKFLAEQVKRLSRNVNGLKSLDEHLRALTDPKLDIATASVEDVIARLRVWALGPTDTGRQRQDRRNVLITFYRQIGDNVQFRVIDAQGRGDFANAVEVLKTERALALAEVTLREREAVIVRGLDGLIAFHQGGIDANDVRNLIMLAQAFGVFAIAAK